MRCETGVVRFEEDWPGVFIRGDNALHYAFELQTALEGLKNGILPHKIILMGLEDLCQLLNSCKASNLDAEITELKGFEQCVS
jgi:hypothetical protein